MPIDETALSRFIETARQQGTVSIADLRGAFSIDAMSEEDIAALVLRLEEAGVSVEIDPALLSPKHGAAMSSPVFPGTRPPPAATGTGPDSRATSDFQGSRPSVLPPEAPSRMGSSSPPRPDVPSNSNRVFPAVVIVLALAALAYWWLSKG